MNVPRLSSLSGTICRLTIYVLCILLLLQVRNIKPRKHVYMCSVYDTDEENRKVLHSYNLQ